MKFLILGLVMIFLSSCTDETKYGPCIGLNGMENKTYVYEYSEENIILGIIFFELIIPPVIVGLDELKCPIRKANLI